MNRDLYDRIAEETSEGPGALIWTLVCFVLWVAAIAAWILTFGPRWPW